MSLRNDRYSYGIIWSEEDKEYVGLCTEFPSLSWLDETPEDALKGIRAIIADVVIDMRSTGEEIPAPISDYSSHKNRLQLVPQVA